MLSNRSADMMPLSTNPLNLTIYQGQKQPLPEERLKQVKIFLADEDYHRNLNFRQKLDDIEKYLEFLELNHYKADGDEQNCLLRDIKEMIDVHKAWIRKATEVPSMSFSTGRFSHRNRLLDLIRNFKKRNEIVNTKAPKLSRELALSSAPALHKCIDEKDRLPSPDPFLYTKQVAEIRRRQDTVAAKLRVNSPALNFNGPYTPLADELRIVAIGDRVQNHKQISAIRDFNGRVNAAAGSIIDIAQPLHPEAELTEIHAARLLQKQIITENNHNWGNRAPNHSKLWGFADGVQKSKTFFSLDRWPLELQTPEQRDKMRQGGPKPYPWAKTASSNRKLLKGKNVIARDPNERYVPGETIFPFGETQIQAAFKSQKISDLLANGKQIA
jgi:hypothetical protein